jgi:transcriptional regulator with XRE-family HTH domain
MSLQRALGQAARLYRTRLLRVSQDELAARIGMHRSYYWACESGRKNLQLSTLERIAAGLGVPLSTLVKMAERLPPNDDSQ